MQAAASWQSKLQEPAAIDRVLWIAAHTLDQNLLQQCLTLLGTVAASNTHMVHQLLEKQVLDILAEHLLSAVRALASQTRFLSMASSTHDLSHLQPTASQPVSDDWGDEEALPGCSTADQPDTVTNSTDTFTEGVVSQGLELLEHICSCTEGQQAVSQHPPLQQTLLQLLQHCDVASVLGKLLCVVSTCQYLVAGLIQQPVLVQCVSEVLQECSKDEEDTQDAAWYICASCARALPLVLVPAAWAADGVVAADADTAGTAAGAVAGRAVATDSPAATREHAAAASTSTLADVGMFQFVNDLSDRLMRSHMPSTSLNYAKTCCQQLLLYVDHALQQRSTPLSTGLVHDITSCRNETQVQCSIGNNPHSVHDPHSSAILDKLVQLKSRLLCWQQALQQHTTHSM